MKSDFPDIVKNKEKIHRHLLFCSTFLLIYEYFVSSWKQGIFFLYTHCKTDIDTNSDIFYTDIKFIKIGYEAFEKLKKDNKIIRNTIKADYEKLEKQLLVSAKTQHLINHLSAMPLNRHCGCIFLEESPL